MAPHAETVDHAVDGWYAGRGNTTPAPKFTVNSPNVTYSDSAIKTEYTYRTTSVFKSADGQYVAHPNETVYDFKVDRAVGKVGMMLVGWGGNNGSHRYCWHSR